MVNKELLHYIKSEEAQGYSSQQLSSYLVQQGYDPKEVNEAINFANRPKHVVNKKLIIISIIFVIIIIISFFFVHWFFTRSICGNGIVEEGETLETCCLDAGCLGEQTCENNVCLEPICEGCQYLENHICKDYDCCTDSDCSDEEICEDHECTVLGCGECQYIEDRVCKDYECCVNGDCNNDEICENHECQELVCSSCQYALNHTCNDYVCCANLDCSDNDISTNDICLNPNTLNATCFYTTEVEITTDNTDVTMNLSKGIDFKLNEEPHKISVDTINVDSVILTIESQIITVTLYVGETKTVDVDGDGEDDISVTLISVTGNEALVRIKRIVYETNEPPVIISAKITPPFGPNNTVILHEMEVSDPDGADDIISVVGTTREIPLDKGELFDDGGIVDLIPERSGLQGSADKVAGDGIYSMSGYIDYSLGIYHIDYTVTDSASNTVTTTVTFEVTS
ncbi:MAG: hypothetical protein KJ597_02170 [Nanoarchaeota archaeon]|nr:hypothetical protein [Nanoarchaeota archaeon]MBU1622357.1 hypothetical protein [Nanoarchaeota archaeon]